MAQPKRVYTGRPRDRSLEAYVAWVHDFVARLIPNVAPEDLSDPATRASAEASWRAYWAAYDQREGATDDTR